MARTAEPDRNAEQSSAPEDLAAEYIAHLSAGESAEKTKFLARCADDRARAEFEVLIRGAERVERSLPRALVAGTVLSGRYRILSEIGGGGMSRVFAALDMRLERRVAVKVPLSQNIGNKEFEDLFIKESKLLASLQHPNIVSVHESGRDGDLAYIVMDLVEGASLAEVIERARKELGARTSSDALSPRDGQLLERAIGKKAPDGRTNLIDARDWYASVARIMLEVARTIEAAHSVRVIHRDLKPGNVMLVGGGNPVVLDFGLAGSSDLEAGTVTQGLYGSVAYLAPEQAQSNKVGMDPRTDVYQLGLILYELLTLRRAFPGTGIGAVLGRIKDGTFSAPRKLNPAVPRDLEAICMMALELDPARRYDSAKALREDLERYVGGNELPLAVRSSRWRSFSRTSRTFVRRHPWGIGLAATLIVGLAVWAETHRATKDAVLNSEAAAPLFSAFRIPPGASKPIPIRNLDPVLLDDLLGLTISTTRHRYLYALSIFRRGDSVRFFAPMRAIEIDEYLHRDAADPKKASTSVPPWVFEASPGVSDRIYSLISQSHNTFEGLLVYSGDQPRNDLEAWLERLDELIAAKEVDGIAEKEAWDEYLEPPRTRSPGRDPNELSDAQRKAFYGNLLQSTKAEDHNLDLPGLRGFEIECPVVKKAK